jgi:leucyl aminopeptidase
MTLESRLIPAGFDLVPSQAPDRTTGFLVSKKVPVDAEAVGYAVGSAGEGARALGVPFESLAKAGFEGKPGQALLLPQAQGPAVVALGVGTPEQQSMGALRDVSAALVSAAHRYSRIALDLGESFRLPAAEIGRAIAEGAILARYRYTELKSADADAPLVSIDLVAPTGAEKELSAGWRIGETTARAANIARDLSNAPPGHLTATRMGEAAMALGKAFGLEVEVFDKQQLIELGCGGLLGVNAGSAEEPRMVKLSYRPKKSSAHVALVGKGIMYDAGGISLKPSDAMHLLMKMDMAGAAAVLGAMTALSPLDCPVTVTGYLMCTDNMPSGTAMGLGDVLTIRGGTTVEIKNTDAEGRLVMADALVLAAELEPDAIVDIATLTGSALQTLGPRVAAVFGNNQPLVDQVVAAADANDEPVWQLPLERRYRPQLDSNYADMSNMGGPFNVAITAALFLNEFVAGIPWAHLDIAGTMQSERAEAWRPAGATGFGTRLLIDLLLDFTPVKR